MSGVRYFPEPAPAARGLLDSYLKRLGESARALPDVRLLLLGGGYGRGEGGLWNAGDSVEPALYNDLEFYLLVTKPSRVHDAWVRREIEAGHHETGIEIEFKVMRETALERARPSMFYYDLLAGHLVIEGDERWLSSLPPRLVDPTAIPGHEATRLLMNRGCSLLLCARAARGEFQLEAGFIDRIAAKLKLALGDAILCATGKYYWSCRERGKRLADLQTDFPHSATIRAWHHEGVQFKFHPTVAPILDSEWLGPVDGLRTIWRDVFLWIEARRLNSPFGTPRNYAVYPDPVLPLESGLSNAIRHIGGFRSRRKFLPGPWTRHPREAVLRSLALLLNPDRNSADIRLAAQLLGCRAHLADASVEKACRESWKQFP
jgi:hypothetical protein